MGYAHGRQWDEASIIAEIKNVCDIIMISRMPSKKEIETVMQNSSLTNVISKRGGFSYWANKCGYEMKDSETKLGKENEFETEMLINSICGLETEQMTTKHPFDLLAGKFVKVDVKSGKKYSYGGSGYYSFNLEKNPATCDIYVCHCLNELEKIEKTFVIPACMLRKTQLSVGENSVYNKYIDRWDYINKFDEFYKTIE